MGIRYEANAFFNCNVMQIGLFGKRYDGAYSHHLQLLVATLEDRGVGIVVPESYYSIISQHIRFTVQPRIVEGEILQPSDIDCLFSIGGDGTLLAAVGLVAEADIPVLGLNFGHLGFLTTAKPADIQGFVALFLQQQYTIETHSLMHVEVVQDGDAADHSYVMNEVSIHRHNNSSMLYTNVYIDDEILATYNGDGLIVATPTGSTAYSLSCGGPVLAPSSKCFVITPVAVHNLTLRPIVVPDTSQIRLVTANDAEIYLGCDSNSRLMNSRCEIILTKERFSAKLIRMKSKSFYSAIREKLMWGASYNS